MHCSCRVDLYVTALIQRWQLPYTPCAIDEPRWSFVRSQCLRALRYSFILDAAQSYVHLNPLFARPLSGGAVLSIKAQGYGFRCLNIVAYMGQLYFTGQLLYTLLSVFCVAIGFYEAKDYPRLFGGWRDSYTVRRFWGSVL